MKKAFIYVRVSTEEQRKHGLSVDSQISALKDYCEQQGYDICDIYNDAGRSAHASYKKRKELLRLIEDTQLKKGSIILFTKLDRWFRSVEDYYEVMAQIPDEIPWRAIWEDYETVTSAGRFKVNIMLSIAQAEAERTSERLKAIFAYKKERGDYIGSAPTGYVLKGRDLLIDEEHREGMEAFFDAYFKSMSIQKAVESAKEHGLPLNAQHMRKLIKNPVYCGEASNGYKCEPYITKEQHELILNTIATRTRTPKEQNRTYIFAGLCLCGYCGHNMVGKAVKRIHANGEKIIYKKYVCQYDKDMRYTCPHLQIVEHFLEDYLVDSLDELIDARIKIVKQLNRDADFQKAIAKQNSLKAKLSRLTFLYEEGDISQEDYFRKREVIKKELSEIIIEPLPEPVPMPTNWKDIYNDLDEQHKQAFWRRIIKNIVVTNENKNHPDIYFL